MVVPDPEVLLPWAKQNGIEVIQMLFACSMNHNNKYVQGDFKALCNNPKVNTTIMEDMTRVGQEGKVQQQVTVF